MNNLTFTVHLERLPRYNSYLFHDGRLASRQMQTFDRGLQFDNTFHNVWTKQEQQIGHILIRLINENECGCMQNLELNSYGLRYEKYPS